jgi:hypothetical protein
MVAKGAITAAGIDEEIKISREDDSCLYSV